MTRLLRALVLSGLAIGLAALFAGGLEAQAPGPAGGCAGGSAAAGPSAASPD